MTAAVVILALIAAAAFFISRQPDEFSVSRSAVLAAPPALIFGQVNDLRNWRAWSPWAKLDPNAKETFEGPPAGKGAVMKWDGNKKVGAGSMTIIESRPHDLVKLRLDFLKPMKATSTAQFDIKPEGAGTRVTWSMHGENNFMAKAMSLVMNCEKMVGGQFEKGLENLRGVVETGQEKKILATSRA